MWKLYESMTWSNSGAIIDVLASPWLEFPDLCREMSTSKTRQLLDITCILGENLRMRTKPQAGEDYKSGEIARCSSTSPRSEYRQLRSTACGPPWAAACRRRFIGLLCLSASLLSFFLPVCLPATVFKRSLICIANRYGCSPHICPLHR